MRPSNDDLTEQRAEQRRLAGAVRADDDVHRRRPDAERNVASSSSRFRRSDTPMNSTSGGPCVQLIPR